MQEGGELLVGLHEQVGAGPAGSVATALGALCVGAASGIVQQASFSASDSYRAVVVLYAVLGAVLAFLFLTLSSS